MKSKIRSYTIQLKISLLGPIQIQLNANDVTGAFRTRKERALFSYLAIESQRIHARESLAEIFWPERPEGYARTNLRQALTGIRRSLMLEETSPPFIHISDEFVRFNTKSNYSLDCRYFDQLMQEVKNHSHEELSSCKSCVVKLMDALTTYRGEFLADLSVPDSNVFEEWVMFQREHYFRQHLTLLQYLIDHHERVGNYNKAQEYAFRQVNLAPLEESAYRQLMTLLVYDGRRSAALEQFHICRKILDNELGVDPDTETTTLYEKIKSGLPLKSKSFLADPIPTNLPTQFSQFVGRESEIAWINDCLDIGIYRMIAIVGMAGVGKTRLAIEVGSNLLNQFPDGVWFVPLSAVDSPAEIIPAIMESLEISSQDDHSRDRLLRYLKGKQVLLIIDNFEHLMSGSEILFDLLRNTGSIVILVTSQQRMNYQAVSSLYLRGLPCPTDSAADDFLDYASIRLFLSRATHSFPGFQIDRENAPHIIRICKLVDGLPLGIELAAGGIRNYSCQQIADDLQNNLGILTTDMKDIPERHRSIRAAFSQSWSLLTAMEKDVYRRLSIFQREFSMDAALSTTGASIPIISSLADKSLIQINSSGLYALQPLLRQFASEKLAEYVDSEESIHLEKEEDKIIPTFDSLTELPNKVLFRYLFQNAVSRARKSQQKVILLLVEIRIADDDDFRKEKLIHDKTIITFANYLKSILQESDVIGHLVKGRFGVLIEGLSDSFDVTNITNRIMGDMDVVESFPQKITAFVGSSIYPEDSTTIDENFRIASSKLMDTKIKDPTL